MAKSGGRGALAAGTVVQLSTVDPVYSSTKVSHMLTLSLSANMLHLWQARMLHHKKDSVANLPTVSFWRTSHCVFRDYSSRFLLSKETFSKIANCKSSVNYLNYRERGCCWFGLCIILKPKYHYSLVGQLEARDERREWRSLSFVLKNVKLL